MGVAAMFWRRIDAPGHDACRLVEEGSGWSLTGAAAFRHPDGPACITYAVHCDDRWRTRDGVVRGWVGERAFDLRAARTREGVWELNGRPASHLDDCVDLDLGFTPATNLFQLRRIALPIGHAADLPVAWVDLPGGTLDRLEQRYERRSAEGYWYTAPRFGYAALLTVNAAGFVEDYPGLWQAER
jgi:hypothetical protein